MPVANAEWVDSSTFSTVHSQILSHWAIATEKEQTVVHPVPLQQYAGLERGIYLRPKLAQAWESLIVDSEGIEARLYRQAILSSFPPMSAAL